MVGLKASHEVGLDLQVLGIRRVAELLAVSRLCMKGRVAAPEAEVARVRAGRILWVHQSLTHAAVLEECLLGRAEESILKGLIPESHIALLESLFNVVVGTVDCTGSLVGSLHVAESSVLAVS